MRDGVDVARLRHIRVFEPLFEAWSLVGDCVPLSGCELLRQPGAAMPTRVLDVLVELAPAPLGGTSLGTDASGGSAMVSSTEPRSSTSSPRLACHRSAYRRSARSHKTGLTTL